MSETIEHQLVKWAVPVMITALCGALVSISSFGLMRITKNSETLAVLVNVVQDGKSLRERMYEDNSKDHKEIFKLLGTLVSKSELEVRVTELRAQIALLESSIKALDVRLETLRVELTKLQLEVAEVKKIRTM